MVKTERDGQEEQVDKEYVQGRPSGGGGVHIRKHIRKEKEGGKISICFSYTAGSVI